MPYTTVIYTKKEHIAYITLNRPETGNIINQQLSQEFEDVCQQIKQDDDIHVVIVTGAGYKTFCLGSELEQLIQSQDTTEILSNEPQNTANRYSVAAAVASIDKTVIAAINGDALGQGLELALSCDIRLAASRAQLGLPQVAYGLIPTDGGTQRLPRIVGKSKALELILTAKSISAEQALELFKKLMGPDMNHKRALYYAARCSETLDDYESVKVYCNAYIKMQPRDSEVWEMLSNAHKKLFEYEEAEDAMQRSQQLK